MVGSVAIKQGRSANPNHTYFFLALGIFVDAKTFHDSEWKLLSVSISGMSILVENWGYSSESWSDTLIKQFSNGIKITSMKTNLNNQITVILLLCYTKLASLGTRFDLAAILGKLRLKPVS